MQRQHVCSAVAMSCAVSQMKFALLTAPRNSVPQLPALTAAPCRSGSSSTAMGRATACLTDDAARQPGWGASGGVETWALVERGRRRWKKMAGVRLGLYLGSSDTYRQLLLVASTWILSTACDHALLPHPCSGSSAGSCKHNKQLSASVSLGEAWAVLAVHLSRPKSPDWASDFENGGLLSMFLPFGPPASSPFSSAAGTSSIMAQIFCKHGRLALPARCGGAGPA